MQNWSSRFVVAQASSTSEPMAIIPDLRGKVVLITGAGTGIGAAAAHAFGRNGAKIAINYRQSQAEAEQVADAVRQLGGEALLVQKDVIQPEAASEIVRRTVEAFGRQDVRFVRDGAMQMQAQGGGGCIINLSSIAARHGGGPGSVLYAATKGFVATATRGWAKELVKDRIRVNAVSPGVIMTPFHERYSTPEQLASMQATIPMGRLGLPEECAGAFLYLASEQLSGYVTGQMLEVNGGQYMP